MSSNALSKMALLQMATWTEDQFETLPRPTLLPTRNAISSPEADSGASPPASPDGPTTGRSGPGRARARGKALQVGDLAPPIQGICGLTFEGSSVPSSRMSSWESRLRQRLGRIGSTERCLIWTLTATPQGRSVSRLAPSMRLTKEIGFIGLPREMWTTASARDWKDSPGMATTASDGRVRLDQLPRQMVAHNPTPTVADVQGGRKARSGARAGEPLLNGLMASYSPTPRASDGEKGGPNQSFGAGGVPLPTHIYAMDRTGPTPNGLSAQSTEKRGAPNPEFAFWLMGFPAEWTSGALAAMQSFRRSQRKSSPRSKKPSTQAT